MRFLVKPVKVERVFGVHASGCTGVYICGYD